MKSATKDDRGDYRWQLNTDSMKSQEIIILPYLFMEIYSFEEYSHFANLSAQASSSLKILYLPIWY